MANELRQRQLGIGGLVEDNPLTASATLFTSAGLASITGGVDASHHMPVILDPDGAVGPPEVAYITSLTSGLGATGATGFARGQEGTNARQHLAGTPWIHAPTLRDTVYQGYIKRTSGDITKTSVTNWADFLTDSDLTVPAFVGDILEYDINGFADATNIALILDVVTRVSGAAVNSFGGGGAGAGSTGDGVLAWLLDSGTSRRLSGQVWYTVQAGDISAGAVTCRMRCRTGGGTRVVSSTASDPLFLSLKNTGPPAS